MDMSEQNKLERSRLSQAISTAKAGNRLLARLELEEIAKADPENFLCWLFLGWTDESPSSMIASLERALEEYPDCALIHHGLAWARGILEFNLDEFSNVSARPSEECEVGFCPDDTPACDQQWTAGNTTSWSSGSHEVGTELGAEDGATSPDAEASTACRIPETPGEEVDLVGVPAGIPPADHGAGCGQANERDRDEVFSETKQKTTNVSSVACDDPSGYENVEADTTVSLAPTEASVVDEASAQPLILAVDDSPTIRKLVTLTLTKYGYRVATAPDGVTALKDIVSLNPALILTDINMPQLDGYQLCKLVKNHKTTSNIPVIMLSGKDGLFDKIRGKIVGCDGYITKPFESGDLASKVAMHLSCTASSS
jgi:twitching motility two-component system response regulator PilG